MTDLAIPQIVEQYESAFPSRDLLALDFFQKYRRGYLYCSQNGYCIGTRNYLNLLLYFTEIHEYNPDHARSFLKRLSESGKDNRNAEAIFTEVIVYRYYIRTVHDGLIRSIDLNKSEADLILTKLDGTRLFFEVMCVMPYFPESKKGEVSVRNFQTHTQESPASIRQKLIHKITEQHQLTAERANYALIDLNDVSICGDFSVLSSLSDGYKIPINKATGQMQSGGYDWSKSFFDDPHTINIRAIIYFDRGDYESRRYIINPMYQK